MTNQDSNALTWDHLVELEPRLAKLEQAMARQVSRQWLRVWYGPRGFKSQLCRLVGASRSGSVADVLASSLAYELAYSHLLAIAKGAVTGWLKETPAPV